MDGAQEEISLEERDAQARVRSRSIAGAEIQLVDDIILQLNHGTALLSGHEHDRGLNFLAGLLVNRAFNSLWRAREDAVCGYPMQSLTQCRGAMEAWGTLWWVERHPESCDRWLWAVVEEVKRPSQRPPTFNEIWKEMDNSQILIDGYDVLSKFAHPKGSGLRWLVHFDPDSTHFHYGPHVDLRDLRTCLYFMVLVGQALLPRVEQLQLRTLGSVDSAWHAASLSVTGRALEFARSIGGETRRTMGADDGLE